MANALAYYDTATITAVKSFIVQAPGGTAVPGMFCNFHPVKNHNIANDSTAPKAREVISADLEL